MLLAPIAVVVDLKAAFMLARNHNLGVAIAKLYLSNRTGPRPLDRGRAQSRARKAAPMKSVSRCTSTHRDKSEFVSLISTYARGREIYLRISVERALITYRGEGMQPREPGIHARTHAA